MANITSGFVNSLSQQTHDLFVDNMREISNLGENEKFIFYDDGRIGREQDSYWRSVRSYVKVSYVKEYLRAPVEFSDSIDNLRAFTEHTFRYIKATTFKPEVAHFLKPVIQAAAEALDKMVKRYEQQNKSANARIVEAAASRFRTCVVVIDDRTILKYLGSIDEFLKKTVSDVVVQHPLRGERIAALRKEIDDGETSRTIMNSFNSALKQVSRFFALAHEAIPEEQRLQCICEVVLDLYWPPGQELYLQKLNSASNEIAKEKQEDGPLDDKQNLERFVQMAKLIIKKYGICSV